MPPRETPTRMESYVLAEDAFDESNLPTVLLLKISGWTPGPINCLRSKIQTDFACEIIEPRLIMPPWRGLWCADVNFLLMFVVCLGLLWALWRAIFPEYGFEGYHHFRIVYIFLILFSLGYWIRLMVAVVARSAIAHGVELCLKEMRRRNVVLLVGFSWGAGVLSELLTRDSGLDTQPAFLLIAPVSSATAVAAMREDAALRLHPSSADVVHVVHASDDPIFCPHPERWENLTHVKNHTLQDIHVFKQPSSRRTLAEITATLFRMKTDDNFEAQNQL